MNKILLALCIAYPISLSATSDTPTTPRTPINESCSSGYSPTIQPQRSNSDSDNSDIQRRASAVQRSKSLIIDAEGTVELAPSWGILDVNDSSNLAGRASPFYANRPVYFAGIQKFSDLGEDEKRSLRNHFSMNDDTLVVPVKLSIGSTSKPNGEGLALENSASRITTDFQYLPLSIVDYENAKNTADGKSQYLPPMLFEDYLTVDQNGSGPRQAHLNVRLKLRKYILSIGDMTDRIPFPEVLGNMIEHYNQTAKHAAEQIAMQAQTATRASLLRIISAKNVNAQD